MRGFVPVAFLVLAATVVRANAQDAPLQAPGRSRASNAAPGLQTTTQKASYAIGFNVGTNIRQQLGPGGVDLAALLLGLQEAFAGKKASLDANQRNQALQTLGAELQEKQAKAGEAAKRKGDEFLAANKKKEGIRTTNSGLQYQILKDGTGKRPKLEDEVLVHYHGTMLDGTVFDSSVERKKAVPFKLQKNHLIEGWLEVMPLMKEGSKWRVFVPSDLAYGPRGNRGIGPNETLVFEIELLKVQ